MAKKPVGIAFLLHCDIAALNELFKAIRYGGFADLQIAADSPTAWKSAGTECADIGIDQLGGFAQSFVLHDEL